MATRTLSFNYVLKQNKNDDSVAFGKYFAEAFGLNSPLSLKGLCNRVAMDQSVFTPEIAKGVIDSGAQAAGTSGELMVAWSQGGEPHEAKFGEFTVE